MYGASSHCHSLKKMSMFSPFLLFTFFFIPFCCILVSNSRKNLENKDTVSHKSSVMLQCSAPLYSRFLVPHSRAQMTFPGWLPSLVCAVGYHVSNEKEEEEESCRGIVVDQQLAQWITCVSPSLPTRELEMSVTRSGQCIGALFP